MKLLRLAAIPAAAPTAVALAALPAQANHSWGGYQWARTGPVTASLVSSLTTDWTGNLSTARTDRRRTRTLKAACSPATPAATPAAGAR